ncbi:hypothetical protein OG361_40120 [Streptomyces sp. NBC_00090]|uniref:hypothetical protein n=1 Tax=Streptomyces sp. NBC_00090 TaxID=2903619 RepID=UPI0032567C66
MRTAQTQLRSRSSPLALLRRVYLTVLLTHLPILAVLLLPQGRSRVSSEAVAGVVTILLVSLVVAALVLSPVVCAWVAPDGARWRAGNALSRVKALIRTDRRDYLRRLGEFAALYVLAQCLGGLMAWLVPYIGENPLHGTDPAAERWVFRYWPFALHAATLYTSICAAFAWYAWRLRQLAA